MTDEIIEAPKAEKKKRINSKKKGSGFEGHIAKTLSDKLAPMQFRRSQSSGAILGGQNAKFMQHFSNDAMALFIGDVVPTNEADVIRSDGWKMKFTLECKFYRSPDNLEHLIDGSRIISWYSKARTDAGKLGKQPLLIFKFNHTQRFCAIEKLTEPVNGWSQYELPTTIKSMVTLHKLGPDPIELRVFPFDEAILDLDWWKLYDSIKA